MCRKEKDKIEATGKKKQDGFLCFHKEPKITTEKEEKMKQYTHLIWDFNGTIYNDVDIGIVAANRLLKNHGLPLIPSKEAYHRVFGFPIIDYYRRLGFDFDKLPYNELAEEWVAYYKEEEKYADVFPDIPSALEKAKEAGLCQLILSATELEMLTGQVARLGILPYFDRLLGLSNIHAYSKEAVGCAWRDENPDASVLMIGDTDHDAGVARAMGVDCILLTTGHQNRETLEKYPCLFVADSATEALERILK